MYPVMQRMNDRTRDHGIEVKDTNQPSTSGVKREEKGKGPALSLIGVETIPEIMPVAERTRSAMAENLSPHQRRESMYHLNSALN